MFGNFCHSARLGIVAVVTAPRLLVLQFQDDDPAGRLGDWLTAAGLELDVRRVDRGETPERLEGYAGLLVMGGSASAYDEDLAGVRTLLRTAVASELPTLGICLGGQLLAQANGGRVVRDLDQAELGANLIAKRTTAATDPLFREMPIAPDVIQWHYDAIVALPPGAVQLASSPVCENQAFRLGRLAWGLQCHVETTPQTVRSWAAHDAATLDEWEVDVERLLVRADGVHDDIEQAWQPFAAAFAEIVRNPDGVSPSGTVPTSVAEPITDPAAIRAALAAEMTQSRVLPMPTIRPPDD